MKFLKQITPPFIYSLSKRILSRPRQFHPQWNTLDYAPLKGVKIFFDPSGPWQKKYLDSSYDKFFFDKISKMNLKGKVVYDIGAHIGFHSFYFARLVGPKGKVYAFEPHPKNIERFRFILDENKDIKPIVSVFDIALSDKKGVEEFNLNNDIESGRSSGGFIESADTIWDRRAFIERGFIKHEVKTFPIDSLNELGVDRAPDIMKIDVEGAESLVLQGAKKTILQHRPLILLEVHSMLNMFNVLSFLYSLSYGIEILKEESDGRCFIEATPKKI